MSNNAHTNGGTAAGVLICDDNDAMRTLLGMIVRASSKLDVVGEASNGNDAVVQAARLQPSVILLDLAMPVRSGLDALPELREVAPDARVIVYSGFAGGIVADDVLALGAAGYLEKGAPPDTIIATLEQALAPGGGSSEPSRARLCSGPLLGRLNDDQRVPVRVADPEHRRHGPTPPRDLVVDVGSCRFQRRVIRVDVRRVDADTRLAASGLGTRRRRRQRDGRNGAR